MVSKMFQIHPVNTMSNWFPCFTPFVVSVFSVGLKLVMILIGPALFIAN